MHCEIAIQNLIRTKVMLAKMKKYKEECIKSIKEYLEEF